MSSSRNSSLNGYRSLKIRKSEIPDIKGASAYIGDRNILDTGGLIPTLI